jgi:DNA-binding CsgD family transcriptional regulator
VDKHLEKQQHFISLITNSQSYLKGEYFNLSKIITKELSKIFNYKRVSVWLFNEDGSELQCISLFLNNKFMPLLNFKSDLYPQYFSLLKLNKNLAINDVSQSQELRSLYDNYFSPNEITDVLDTSIQDGRQIVGVLRIEMLNNQNKKKWKVEDISISTLTSTIIGSAYTLNKRIDLEEELFITKKHLKESNITLKNVLDKFEIQKNSYNENIAINIERNITPLLSNLKANGIVDKDVIKRLEIGISNLSSPFYKNLVKVNHNLTPTQFKICQMIKGGYQGKEIANVLNLSFSTVETHKKNIRKKLKITGKSINLRVYLNELES